MNLKMVKLVIVERLIQNPFCLLTIMFLNNSTNLELIIVSTFTSGMVEILEIF